MKKLIYILIALTAFTVGVVVFYLRPIVTPVSLCEISQHAELYRFNEIRVKAYLFSVGKEDSDFYTVSDYKNGCVTGASLDISEKLKNNANLGNLIQELRQKNNALREQNAEGKFVEKDIYGFFDAEVEVTGKIEGISSCFGMPFVIKTENIKQISPIRFISSEEIQHFINSK